MSKILTITVPTYNAEKYLRDCLDSFCIEEVLPDIEVLIINDGSTDRSAEIADEYIRRYPDSFRMITKENGGHGSGINYGIKNASGKYFKVVDADDWVDEKAFGRLIETLKAHDTDIVYSGFLWAFDNGESDKTSFETKPEIPVPFDGVVYQKEYNFDDIADGLYIKMHSLTIRTEILRDNGIHIDEHCFYVDAEYITFPIPYIKTICFMDGFVYLYRIGRQGQSVGIDKMQRNESGYNRVLASLLDFYHKLGKEISCSKAKRQYIAGIIARVVSGKIKIMLSFPASKEKCQELRQFDESLARTCPEVYSSNINKAVAMLRKSHYLLYYPASFLARRKYR